MWAGKETQPVITVEEECVLFGDTGWKVEPKVGVRVILGRHVFLHRPVATVILPHPTICWRDPHYSHAEEIAISI
jgi:hypothetical protein